MSEVVRVSNSRWSEAFRFNPNIQQIVTFLENRLKGLQVPGIQGITIKDVNIYDGLTPSEIFAKSELQEGSSGLDKERYCFTELKRTTKGGSNFVRTTRGGTWKLQKSEEIKFAAGTTALKRAFTYKRSNSGSSGPQGPDDCGWVMYEYSLIASAFQGQDIALCKIIKKKKKLRKLERSEENVLRNGSSETARSDLYSPLSTIISASGDGLCKIPTPTDANEGYRFYGVGDEMMPSTTMIPCSPCNDVKFTLEQQLGTTSMPSTRCIEDISMTPKEVAEFDEWLNSLNR